MSPAAQIYIESLLKKLTRNRFRQCQRLRDLSQVLAGKLFDLSHGGEGHGRIGWLIKDRYSDGQCLGSCLGAAAAGRRDGVAAHGHEGTTRRALSVFNYIASTSGILEPDF